MDRRALSGSIIALMLLCLGLSGCGGSGSSRQAEQPVKQAQAQAREDSIGDLLAKKDKITAYSYDWVMTNSDGSITGKLWVDGGKMRSESQMADQKTVAIVDGKDVYLYMPDQGKAMKMPNDKNKAAPAPGAYTEKIDAAKIKVLETATYEGASCKVVVTETEDKQKAKIWLRVSDGFLMKVEFADEDGDKIVMEYKNVKVGPVPAEIFRLPAGVQIKDMTDLQPKH